MMPGNGDGVIGLIFRQVDYFNFYTLEYSRGKLRFKIMKNGYLSGIFPFTSRAKFARS